MGIKKSQRNLLVTGFTLIEFLIVVLVLGAVAAIATGFTAYEPISACIDGYMYEVDARGYIKQLYQNGKGITCENY